MATVSVSNLSRTAREKDIRELFSEFGELNWTIRKRFDTIEVNFKSIDDAKASIKEYHGRTFDSKEMKCSLILDGQSVIDANSAEEEKDEEEERIKNLIKTKKKELQKLKKDLALHKKKKVEKFNDEKKQLQAQLSQVNAKIKKCSPVNPKRKPNPGFKRTNGYQYQTNRGRHHHNLS